MGAAARRRAEEHFAWPDIARRLEKIYERVIARPSARERVAA
jgi:glycosyltransferase involved in cell wall biosynthesis